MIRDVRRTQPASPLFSSFSFSYHFTYSKSELSYVVGHLRWSPYRWSWFWLVNSLWAFGRLYASWSWLSLKVANSRSDTSIWSCTSCICRRPYVRWFASRSDFVSYTPKCQKMLTKLTKKFRKFHKYPIRTTPTTSSQHRDSALFAWMISKLACKSRGCRVTRATTSTLSVSSTGFISSQCVPYARKKLILTKFKNQSD